MNIPNPATLRQLVAEYLGRTPAAHDACASALRMQQQNQPAPAAGGTRMPCGRPTPCPGVCRCVQW